MWRQRQSDCLYRGSADHRQDFDPSTGQGRIAATTRIAAGHTGLARFGLDCIDLDFYPISLHTTATEKDRLPGDVLPDGGW